MRYLFIFFQLLFLCAITSAQHVIKITPDFHYTPIGKSLSYFEDKRATLSIEDIKSIDANGQFTQSQRDVLNFGNSTSAFWVKLSYSNYNTNKAYLVLDASSIEEIDFYAMLPDMEMIHQHAGSIVPGDLGVIVTNNYTFKLPRSVDTTTVYLRVKTNNILVLPLRIITPEKLIPGSFLKNNAETIYIGFLLAIVLLALFISVTTRDYIYLLYGLYILFSTVVYFILYLRGYSYLLGDDVRRFINLYPHAFSAIGSIAAVLFIKNFLNVSVLLPRFIIFLRILLVGWVIIMIVSFAGFKSLGSHLIQSFSLVTAVINMAAGIAAYRKGYHPALYYILSLTFINVMIVLFVLTLADVFPYTERIYKFAPVIFTLDLLLLSLALGDRLNTLKKDKVKIQEDKLQVQEENLYLIKTQNERLEKVVEERTLKLNETIDTLEEANAIKNKLFSIIAHDLRSPFNSIISIFSLKDMDMLTFEELKVLLNESRDNIHNVQNTVNNLLSWAKSQMEETATHASSFDIKLTVESLMQVYEPLIIKKDIKYSVITNGEAIIYADENQINLIMRNLIDNAIKFTPVGYSFTISINEQGSFVEICVANPGNEKTVEHVKKALHGKEYSPTYGTSNERGVGLGLKLCKEYIANNGSELIVDNKNDCIQFAFMLPKN